MRQTAAALVLALLLLGAFQWVQRRSEHAAIAHDGTTLGRDNYQANPTEVPCPKNLPVLLIIGQSNAANYGETRKSSEAVNFYRGRCYRARDPLLGASGDRGSIWTRLPGPTLLVPVAIGSTHMKDWTPGGKHFGRIERVISELRAVELRPSHALIIQGESEGNSKHDPRLYARNAKRLVSYLKTTGAKVYMARSSRCKDEPNLAIREAQRQSGALPGPDMDAIPYRINFCHLDDAGLSRAAAEWAKVLR